ncbi:protein rep [Bacillus mycoides]|uniref:protein rep n=1 Tax=Bacillus mycoides TaxID=1405 RepID=UPI0005CB1B7C|nr:protein rep [Bacillus mycoides]
MAYWFVEVFEIVRFAQRKLVRDDVRIYSMLLSEGGYIALLTLTFGHNKADRLKETLEKFGNATRKLMSGRAYNNIRDELDLIGRIQVFEVTYSKNGFHPHVHIALFYMNDVELKIIEKKYFFVGKGL